MSSENNGNIELETPETESKSDIKQITESTDDVSLVQLCKYMNRNE